MIQFENIEQNNSIILVIGVGGGGSNSVNYMHKQNIKGVRYMICNTDLQALDKSAIEKKIQLGPNLTKGLGAGFNPKVGKDATIESKQDLLKELQQGVKMAFITAGMGKGTGTGGAPVVAQMCKELGILTVAVVTTPFTYEGNLRKKCAEEGILELRKYIDIIIVVNNDKIRQHYGDLGISKGLAKVDDVVTNAIKSITNIIYSTGTIGVDFADVCNIMRNGGMAIMGVAQASGEDRSHKVAQEALNSPLLNDIDIKGAKQILVNLETCVGDYEVTSDEIENINRAILDQAGNEANLVHGIVHNEKLNKEIGLTIIVTGFQTGIEKNNIEEKKTELDVNLNITNKQTIKNEFNFNNSNNNIQKNKIEKENIEIKSTFKPQIQNISKLDFFIETEDSITPESNQLFIKDENTNETNNDENEIFLNTNKLTQNSEEEKKGLRAKMFEPYSYSAKKAEINSKIFYDKTPSQINFNIDKEIINNNHQFNSLQIKHNDSDGIVIKKNNEYTEFYEKKRVD